MQFFTNIAIVVLSYTTVLDNWILFWHFNQISGVLSSTDFNMLQWNDLLLLLADSEQNIVLV